MTLDRSLALVFLVISIIYSYTAFVSMEASLLPFERNMTFLPNTMPKWLGLLSILCAFVVVLNSGPKSAHKPGPADIDYRRLGDYKLGQALGLIGAMLAYALFLRWLGFLLSTVLFLSLSAVVLGERNVKVLLPTALIAAGLIWYLVQELLGIYLRPLPYFFGQ